MVSELRRRSSLRKSTGRSRDGASRVAASPEGQTVPLMEARRDPPAAATAPRGKRPSKTPTGVKRKRDETPPVSPKSEEEPPKSPPGGQKGTCSTPKCNPGAGGHGEKPPEGGWKRFFYFLNRVLNFLTEVLYLLKEGYDLYCEAKNWMKEIKPLLNENWEFLIKSLGF